MGNSNTVWGSSIEGSIFLPSEPHEVRLAVTEILTVVGVIAYHSSVIVDDCEFFFDRLGVMAAAPLWSHTVGQAKPRRKEDTEVMYIGRSPHSGKLAVKALYPFFQKGTYDILYKNCNAFTDCALYFLTRTRLNAQYNRLERMIAATDPVSTGLMNQIFRAHVESTTGSSCDVDLYTMNPYAADFTVEDVINNIDRTEGSDGSSEDSDTGGACGIFSSTRDCQTRRVEMPFSAGLTVPQDGEEW